MLAWVIVFLVGGFLIWAHFSHLDEVSIAVGEVVPQGQIKTIQHLEGGIIQRIFVSEGNRVIAGDPLVQLDLTASSASKEELAVRLDGLQAQRIRLIAEVQGKALEFPETLSQRRPDMVANESATYDARQLELNSGLEVLREQVRQKAFEVQQFRTRSEAAKNDIELARQEFAISTDLLKDDLIPRIEHLKRQREVEALEGELKTLAVSIPRAAASLAEAKERLREETLKYRRIAREELAKVEVSIAQITESLTRASDLVRRTEIRSPIDGVVKSLRYHTIGGVVRPGEAIMEIVPTQEKLVIEAKLSPIDVGYVRVGQPTVVKISTYDFARYGGLEGEVINLSADSLTDREGVTYFRVIAQTDRTYLGNSPGDLPIAPGMQATVDIHTGSKSVLQYMLKPVLKLKDEAFRER
jgi:adhesin transport system membrane fusion protein